MYALYLILSVFQLFSFHVSTSNAVSIALPSASIPNEPPLRSAHQALNPRAQYTIGNDYSVHFLQSAYSIPIQVTAAALTTWYGGVRRVMNLPPSHEAYNTFAKPFGFSTDRLKMTFTPLDPLHPSNLAMRSMAAAFVEWVQERAREGFCELYEASVSGRFGTLLVSFELMENGDGTPT